MDFIELLEIIETGEDSKTQFKEFFSSPDALAAEITAFANTKGGRIVVGVSDDGELIGLTLDKVNRLNQMISNVCSQKIDPPLSVETENVKYEDRIVVVINVPRGINKFYVANRRDVWVKVGADKRRASREEMRRLLQESSNIFADEQPIPGTDISSLDMSLLEGFIENKTGETIENTSVPLKQLLNNMKLMHDDNCTLAGLLLFGKMDNQILSQHIISAVSWYGNDPAGTEYRDSEDIVSHIKDIKDIPYRGIGTGITRIIKSCKEEGVSVDFIDEVEKNQFKVVFWRE